MDNFELAPLRNLDDFLLASSRFQVRTKCYMIFNCSIVKPWLIGSITGHSELSQIIIRFILKVPDTSNLERCANRITSNLLYYQTNYLLSAAIIFTLVAYIHPQDMFLGMLIVVCIEKVIA